MGTAPSSRIGSDPARRRFMEERQRGVYDFVGGLSSVLFISVRNTHRRPRRAVSSLFVAFPPYQADERDE